MRRSRLTPKTAEAMVEVEDQHDVALMFTSGTT